MAAKSDKHLLEADWIPEWRKVFQQRQKRILDLYRPNLKQYERHDFQVTCPCCGLKVRILEQRSLQDLNEAFVSAVEVLARQARVVWFSYLNGDLFHWVKIPFTLRIWACDNCVKAGRAELANFETIFLLNLQSAGGHRPYFYFDQTMICHTCLKEFLVTKSWQRWAHQQYIISSDAKRHNCPDCQKSKIRQHWLEHILIPANPTFDNLYQASQILLEFSDPRALIFLRRAKNKAKNLEQKARLEAQILKLES